MKVTKTSKRILSSLLATLVVASTMPFSVISTFAAERNSTAYVSTLSQPAFSDGYYQISNADELYWFADYVNSGHTSANAVLTKNIVVNSGTLSSTTNSSLVRTWTPIGNKNLNASYSGTFDGKGYSIKGLYLNDKSSNYIGLFGSTYYANIKNVTVSNSYISAGYGLGAIVGVDNYSTITNCHNLSTTIKAEENSHVGGIVGDTTGSTISNCTNSGSVSGYYYYIGGIAGIITNSTIENCSNTGDITCTGWREVGGIVGLISSVSSVTNCTNSGTVKNVGMEAGGIAGAIGGSGIAKISLCTNTASVIADGSEAAGIVADSYGAEIVNCFNSGKIESKSTYAGGIVANAVQSTITANCLNVGSVSDTGSVYAGSICGRNNSGCGVARCYSLTSTPIGINEGVNGGAVRTVTADELHNGSIAYFLRAGVSFKINDTSYSFSGSAWGQDLLYADPNPTLNSRRIYYGYDCTGSSTKVYSNYPLNSSTKTSHTYSNGICACGKYATPSYSNGAYRIANAGNLYWFMEYVNAGNTTANAVLTNNITVNYGTFDKDGNFTPASSAYSYLHEWFPIGYYYDRKNYDNKNEDVYYSGTFDGNGYSISGLYFDKSIGYAGLFGQVKNATIKNLDVQNSYFKGTTSVGGVCGRTYEKSYIYNCSANNIVYSTGHYLGGICGNNTSTSYIVNCFNRGLVQSSSSFCGGVLGTGNIYNCYNLEDACQKIVGSGISTSSSQQTFDSLKNNAATYSLQSGYTVDGVTFDGSIWGVKEITVSTKPLLTVPFPALNGNTVYKRYTCESNVPVYTTNSNYGYADANKPHKYENGVCSVCNTNEPKTGVEINQTNFPDEIFRNIVKTFDTSGNGWLSDSEIENTQTIDATNRDINNLKGIEYFTELRVLYAYGNNLTTLDVSQNKELVMLNCGENQLTNLDVSQNTKLVGLYCYSNQITSLDFSMLKELDSASFGYNKLTELDFTENPVIRVIYCQNNNLKKLVIGQNETITLLMCNNNNLPYIDLSGCPNISTFKAENNIAELESVDCTFAIDGLDMSKISSVTGAEISNDEKFVNISSNTITYNYNCGNNCTENFTIKIGTINHNYVDGTCTICNEDEPNTGIEINETNFPDSNFRELVVTFDTNSNGFLSNSEINKAQTMDATYRNIYNLQGIEFFTNLRVLYVYGNKLTTLDVSNNKELVMLNCGENSLTTLDVSNNTKLAGLYCYSNYITNIDISMLTELDNASFVNNYLTELDLSNNVKLRVLYCQNNSLAKLDLSKNVNLSTLWCNENNLLYLDLSNCPNIQELQAANNCVSYGKFPAEFVIDGLDMSKVSNVIGATIVDGKFVAYSDTIMYTYDCGYDNFAIFTIMGHVYKDGICINCNECIMGDVDLDGELTINDVTLIQQYIAKMVEFSENQKILANVYRDNSGYVNIEDVTCLQRILASY